MSEDRTRQAADAIASLLASTLQHAFDTRRTFLYIWEEQALDWLAEQWQIDPGTEFNAWTAQWVTDRQRLLDLLRATPNTGNEGR